MIEQFKTRIRNEIQISDENLNKIVACVRPETIKRNGFLLSQGQVCKKFYFLTTGCIRTYYIDKKGNEKTRLILFENSPFTVLTSFITQQPSMELCDALEDSEVLSMSHADFFRFVDEIPRWEHIYRKLLEITFIFQNQRIEDLVTLSAKERYNKLIKERPHYIQRLSNSMLASYLDMSQETLSRLKSK